MVQKILLKLLADRAWEHEASIHTKFEFEKKGCVRKKNRNQNVNGRSCRLNMDLAIYLEVQMQNHRQLLGNPTY
jgi:hypothetical protein